MQQVFYSDAIFGVFQPSADVLMRYLVIGLLITLAACEPYRGSVSATPRWSENCGTPDTPKRCTSYRPRPAQVSAPLPDYN
jgi:hypothetical protein